MNDTSQPQFAEPASTTEASGLPQTMSAKLYAEFFAPRGDVPPFAPVAAMPQFQIFSLYDSIAPVIYTNHTS